MWKILFFWFILGLAVWAQERELFREKSPYTTVLVVGQGAQRILKFQDGANVVEESRCDVHRPWVLEHLYLRLQLLALAFAEQNDDLLVIGLGGGSLSNQLARSLPAARIDSVELDPVVVKVARRYFGYREDERKRAFVADGRDFVARSGKRYDVIFLDAFDGLEIPSTLRTQEFYQLLKEHLKPGGAIVTNLHECSPLYASDRNTLQSVFSQCYAFPALAQACVVCQDAPPRHRTWILERAAELAKRAKLDYPMEKLAASLLEKPNWDEKAALLKDK